MMVEGARDEAMALIREHNLEAGDLMKPYSGSAIPLPDRTKSRRQ